MIMLRYGEEDSLKWQARYMNCDVEKVEVIKKKIFEHEFSAQNNVHKGSNQIKALQTL